jgi:enoyl-[acyl-carrier protein] reductase II
MQTRLTEILDIEHPVMLAGMGGVSSHALVSAVSAAGGYGCMGASTMRFEDMVDEIAQVRAATDKPFGVDLLTAFTPDLAPSIEMIAAGGATAFVAGLGVPRDVIDLCHSKGLLVINMCGKVRHAIAAVEAGCDLVVAQGTEAGGHTGTVATLALVPQIVDAVGDRVPVVAAGGIGDGRGLVAALSLGADGVWVGTRFIATPEARTVAGYKDRLVTLAEDETVVTRAYTGKTCRVVRNDFTNEFDAAGGVAEPFPAQLIKGYQSGANHLGGDESTPGVDPTREFMPAGQGAGMIRDITPAGDIVRSMVAEAEAVIERVAALR